MRFTSPLSPDAAARRQYSFSRLSGRLHARPAAAAADDAEGSPSGAVRPVDPVGLGTLVHAVLAEIDFAAVGDVPALVERLAPWHLPGGEGPQAAVEMIARFLRSPRALQIAGGQVVHRELEFLLAWPSRTELIPSGGAAATESISSAPVFLQGFIDCLYQDPGGMWRLVDYKSNQVTAATMPQVAAGYEMQMMLYALAVERILGVAPVELVLCFLRPGLEYRFSWDMAGRQRVRGLIDAAIAADAGGGTRGEGLEMRDEGL